MRSNIHRHAAMQHAPFSSDIVKAVFDGYPQAARPQLLALRALILETARGLDQVDPLIETVKWKQAAYLPAKPRVGTTIRIDALKKPRDGAAIYFHCQTSLVATFRHLYREHFTFEANRAIHLAKDAEIPREALKHCIALALTYHLKT